MANINELAAATGELYRSMNRQAGLNPHSPVFLALASGLDIAITVFEQSTGARVSGLSRQSAERVVQYFQDEAERSENVDPQIAIYYRAWARVLASKYLSPESSLEAEEKKLL